MLKRMVDESGHAQVGWLLKAIASGNSMSDACWMWTQIQGQSDDWMMDNLTLSDPRAQGNGIKQQFSHTCGVTTVQALRGDYDPVYSLRTRRANTNINNVDAGNGDAVNPAMAAEQRNMHQQAYSGSTHGAHSGVIASRSNLAAGGGRWKLGAIKDSIAEVNTIQRLVTQVGTTEVGSVEPGSQKLAISENGTLEVCLAEICLEQIGFVEE